MPKRYKVSVIVPIYNVEMYLERCLESLVNQTLKEIQIILVNDGSPDRSQDIIDRYAKKYPDKIEALIKENGGLSDARNYGISFAQGEYIGFVDSDDYLDITMYEKMYQKALAEDADIVVCGYYGVDEQKNSFRSLQTSNKKEFGVSLYDNPKLLYSNAPYAWNKLYRKELIEQTKIRFPKGKIYEDIATIYPLMQYANKIVKVNEPLYYYILKREGAITATFSNKILQQFEALSILNEHYLAANHFDYFRNELEFINLKHTIYRFRDFKLYTDRKLQFAVIKKGFDNLDKYFDDWKNNDLFFETFYGNNKLKKYLVSKRLSWYCYALIPNCLKKLGGKITRYGKKCIKTIAGKRSTNKYYYAYNWKYRKIKENRVLFESFHGTALNDSPFAMMLELAKDPQFEIYYTSKKALLDKHQNILDAYGLDKVKLVALESKQYQRVLATSKYLINCVSFPTYFIRREGQIYLNTWHGTPLKTLGKKMAQGIQDMSNIQRNFLQSTHLLHPNSYTMNHMMEDYNLTDLYTGKVILNGYPRNAIFMDKKVENMVKEKYGMKDKEILAYMPTWRGATSNNANGLDYEDEVKAILTEFDNNLNENQIMYVNLHPLVKDKVKIEGFKHILTFPTDVDNYTFISAVDVLITDYSSVFFDYSLTKKPIVLFMYDYDNYMEERGMYMDVKSLPFEKIYTMEDMIVYLKRKDKKIAMNHEWYAYVDKFIKHDKIENARMINNYIFYNKQSNLKIYDYKDNAEENRTIYFAEKLKHNEDREVIENIKALDNSLIVFERKDFTAHTLNLLGQEYSEDLNYVVCDNNMLLSFLDNLRVHFSRKFNLYVCNDLYEREFRRILPNIKIKKILIGKKSYRNNSLLKTNKEMRHKFY